MSLNRVILLGRITRDLELKQTPNGVSVLPFSIAVDRNFVKQGEERQTDFIDCVAWRQQGEFISKFFGKGRMIAIEGELQVRTYQDKDGNNRKTVEVVVSSASFTGEKRDNSSQNVPSGQPPIASPSPMQDFAETLTDDCCPF